MALRQSKDDKRYSYLSHKRSPKQEQEAAQRLGGIRTKGSGCGFEKGDVRVRGILRLQNKTTIKESFSFTRKMAEEIENAALQSGELPAIEIEFIDKDTGKVLHQVAVVPLYVLQELVDISRE